MQGSCRPSLFSAWGEIAHTADHDKKGKKWIIHYCCVCCNLTQESFCTQNVPKFVTNNLTKYFNNKSVRIFHSCTADVVSCQQAFENAITVVYALGGSTNSVLHLLALAREWVTKPWWVNNESSCPQFLYRVCILEPTWSWASRTSTGLVTEFHWLLTSSPMARYTTEPSNMKW